MCCTAAGESRPSKHDWLNMADVFLRFGTLVHPIGEFDSSRISDPMTCGSFLEDVMKRYGILLFQEVTVYAGNA